VRKWRGNPWAILIVLSVGFFMTLLDLTIVNIAIPSVADNLGASLDQILWVVNAYTLVLAVMLITAGRLGDLRGKKRLFITGVAIFTLASLACGLAQSPVQLIAFRAIQGVGAALLLPQTLSMIIDTFPADRRGAALGVWGATAGLSSVAGPSLGGLLITKLDWRWVFFINVPVGALVLIMAVPILPAAAATVRHRFDVVGVLLASASLFCLTFGLVEGQRYDWNGWIWALLTAAAVLFAIFLVHQRSQQDNEPLVPFSLFRDRNFSIMNVVGIAVSFGVIGLFLPMTIYLQSVLGFTALRAGLVLVPMALGAMVMAGPAGVLSDRFGGKYILMGGLLAFAGGTLWILAIADVGTSWTAFLAPFFVIGMGAGCTFTPMATEVMRNVPPHLTGAASGVNNALRQVGSVLAAAVVGAVLQNKLVSALGTQARERAGGIPAPFRDSFVHGYTQAGSSGLQVGTGQTGAPVPAGVPQDAAQRIHDVATQVFRHGFVDTLSPTMGLTVAVLLGGAVACLAVKRYRGPAADAQVLPGSEPETAHAVAARH
jgi:EmrB/QacA subfamily drug resistance transporter